MFINVIEGTIIEVLAFCPVASKLQVAQLKALYLRVPHTY